jgi:site-specific DNA-methyltransferase (adenine-specific)
MLEVNKIYNMNCVDGLKLLNNESIDLTITSPPYKEADGFSFELIQKVAKELYRVHKKNTLCFVNFGHLAGYKSRPFLVALEFEKSGFEWIDTITWIKNHYTPIQGNKRLNNLTEFIFMFSKGKNYYLDRLSIGIPYKDKSNIGRYSNKDLRCGGNTWYIPYETIQNKKQKIHKDRFPLGLPEKCIKLSNIPKGSIVLDPFMGGGTTAVVAEQLEMNFIGFEIDKKNIKQASIRLKNNKKLLGGDKND